MGGRTTGQFVGLTRGRTNGQFLPSSCQRVRLCDILHVCFNQFDFYCLYTLIEQVWFSALTSTSPQPQVIHRRGEVGRVDRWRKENFFIEFHQMSRHQTCEKYLVWGPTDAVAHAVSSNCFGDASQELSFLRILPSCGSDQVLLKVQQMEMKA